MVLHGVDHYVHTEHVTETGESEALRSCIKLAQSGLLVTVAELVSSRLRNKSPGTYRRWLKDTVGNLEPT